MDFVTVPSGTFSMGAYVGEQKAYGYEFPQHTVMLSTAYHLGKYEITQGQWEAIMGSNPAVTGGCGSWGVGPDYPVYCVSWTDIAGAGGFVDELNTYLSGTGQVTGFRLPTEAEWEKAARAESLTRFPWGDVLGCDNTCSPVCPEHDPSMVYCGNDNNRSEPVGSKSANAYGLHDMHGSLWEWVDDWFSPTYYSSSPSVDPPGPVSGSSRVARGGGWVDVAESCRSAYRNYQSPGSRFNSFGFRLARSQ